MNALSHFAARNVLLARLLITLLGLLLLGLGIILGLLLYGDINPTPQRWLMAGLCLMTLASGLRLALGGTSGNISRIQSRRLMVLGFLASACLPVSLGMFLGESLQPIASPVATPSHYVHRTLHRSAAPQTTQVRPQKKQRLKRWLAKTLAPLIRKRGINEKVGARGLWYLLIIAAMAGAEIGLAHLACGFLCSGPVFVGYLILFGGGFLVFLLGGFAYVSIFKFQDHQQRRNLAWTHALVLIGLCIPAVFISGAVPLILTGVIGIIFTIMGYKLKRKKVDGGSTEDFSKV